ncbi:MAG TPA: hypothetical protein VFQ44_31160 [Streptosporangiaceae bacterium]|nr:hypothetical protein [Streptosporangiaceae bacterium]
MSHCANLLPGYVTTIDIDPEVSARAAASLERAGFPGVRVATGMRA